MTQTKQSCFRSISFKWSCFSPILLSKGVITAFESTYLSRNHPQCQALAPFKHEEADTYVSLYAMNMANNNLKILLRKSSGIDFVFISVKLYPNLGVKKLWLDLIRTGQKRVFYPVHIFFVQIGIDTAKCLLFSLNLLFATKY